MGATRRIRRYQRGTEDTIPAMLSPHEAVLMPIAADLVGRDKIRQANAIGNQIQATLTPQQLDLLQQNRTADAEMRRRLAMNEMPKPIFGFAGGTDDVKDLLRETENTFYGGGTAMPQPTPKPTPVPRLYAYGTENVDDTMGSTSYMDTRRNAASRYPRRQGIVNVTPDSPVSGSRYLGPNGTDLGPQYDQFGSVNPLPRGAVGIQGDQNAAGFNRSLNGVSQQQPQYRSAKDIAKSYLTAAGSSLGSQQQQNTPGFQPYVSPEDAAAKGLQWTGGSTGWQPYVSPEQATEQNLQYTGGNPALAAANQMANERQQAQETLDASSQVQVPQQPNANPPPGLNRGGTSFRFQNGAMVKVDTAPPQPRRNGYGSAYGY